MARLKKPADERLFILIRNWLSVYLPTERRASPCTIANYRQALNQFLTYLAERNETKLAEAPSYMQWVGTYVDEKMNEVLQNAHVGEASANRAKLHACHKKQPACRLAGIHFLRFGLQSGIRCDSVGCSQNQDTEG